MVSFSRILFHGVSTRVLELQPPVAVSAIIEHEDTRGKSKFTD